jgi:DNA-binding SARP family transcriptional activator/Tfp pilus assembly protein PilF
MHFGVLGPLLVHDGERVRPVPGARPRVLLAALLVHAGQPVSAGALAETVWDEAPPAAAVSTLRSHVKRLRQSLGAAAGQRIVTRAPGYLIEAAEDEVDLLWFAARCQAGGAAVHRADWPEAHTLLDEALALWRGTPFADVPSSVLLRDEVPRLEWQRLQALEWRAEAALQLGRHGQLVSELQSLAAAHPLRERFWGQLMLALYRCGRPAEALAAFQQARQVLVDQLGAEPGPELRDLHQRILAADPELARPELARTEPAPPAAAPETAAAHPAVPRELPAGPRHFAGRTRELATLTELLNRAGAQAPGTVVISAIGGTAGVGKTALAICWAHQIAGQFPDGQLYVNLRGYDPDQPTPATDALAGFLHALGVPGPDIPPDADQRAARYRSLLAGRRVLIVLDNAGSEEQVRPLLPASSGCAVVVTSRDTLAGLVVRDGAVRLDLDLLPLRDSVDLLQVLIGDRAGRDADGAAALADQCARLPLALRVAAELAVTRPDTTLGDLAGELAGQQRRLDLLQTGQDDRTAVRAVFSWSYRHLDPEPARAFRLAGLHPGAFLDSFAVAALTGAGRDADGRDQAGPVLGQLARANLVQPAGPGRYVLHDLLRAYARELAGQDSETERRAALTRLLDGYLYTAAAAMDILYPAERHRRPRVAVPVTPVPPLATPAAARDWLDAQRATLVAVAAHGADGGWPSHASQLAMTLTRYLDSGGHYTEATTIHAHASRAARELGDRAAEASALNSLGLVAMRQGRYEQADRSHGEALELLGETGDRAGEARTLTSLGNVAAWRGRYEQSAQLHRRALDLIRQTSDRVGEARALAQLSVVYVRQGRYQQAAGHLRESIELCRATGERSGEGYALDTLGQAYLHLGVYEQASEHFHQALALLRESGDRGEAHALANLGDVCLRQNRTQQASGYFQQALIQSREIGDPVGEWHALHGLGEVSLLGGQPESARAQLTAALRVARRTGDRAQQATSHSALARSYRASGQDRQARDHWRQALALYTILGSPEAAMVRALLTPPVG